MGEHKYKGYTFRADELSKSISGDLSEKIAESVGKLIDELTFRSVRIKDKSKGKCKECVVRPCCEIPCCDEIETTLMKG